MAEHRLMRRVEEVAGRLQRVRRFSTRARIWLLLALVGVALLAANALLAEPLLSPPLSVAAGLLLILGGGLLGLRARAGAHDAALAVERRYPDLDSRLVTALAQRPDYEVGGFSFLQSEVISEALLHAQRNDWRDAVAARALAGARFRQASALVLCAAAFIGAAVAGVRPLDSTSAGAPAEGGDELAGDAYRLQVEPGDVELERGTALLVLARFAGKLPEQVTLVASAADGTRQELSLSKSLEDPLFGGRIASVASDLRYHVRFDDRQSDEYRVRVFDYPQLLQSDATIVAPEYTGLEVKHIEDVRRVSVVEGSKLTLTCTLNKAVASARLFDDLGEDLILTPDETTPNIVSVTWTPESRRTLMLELVDESGRRNRHPPEFVIDVIPNQPPDLKIAFPARDMRVSPLQELPLEAQVLDDFGLQEFGLVYQLPDGQEQTLKLGEGAGADAKVDLAHELSFESFQAQPNDLVAYYFYADDVGPDGGARRTMSNMYFAEVRHFDELYRQSASSGGESQQQQQQQGEGSPAQQLLKLQREIVTATWNLLRRERGEPSPELPEDAGVVADSQAEALAGGQQLQANLEDLLSQQYLTEALKQMTTGEKLLRESSETPAIDPLGDARLATQAAYSALLKLQAREHLVQQSQNSQSSSSSSGQQQQLQQQLQQLELKNDRNRYESEQQASQQSDREAMQVLNRLRELARRQGDLNEKIKELENALRAAQTQKERDEIERQLKRLQQEQQQLLRDLEEAQERMEQPHNRSQMAEARQQLEQTREHLRQTKESLEAGQVSKALAEGTRAERELEDLEEQFRDRTAGQFEERMRQLRRDTRELAENEEQLSEQLTGGRPGQEEQRPPGFRPQLREEKPPGEDKDVQQTLAEQQQKLTDIMQQAEDIVRESETSEPLLSKKLYDAVRNTRVDQPQESLSMTSQFLRLGLNREAAEAEQQARRGIDKLREGVEQAAESVLGNEAEALERARRELDELSRSIASELAQADPEFADEERRRQQQESQGASAADSSDSQQQQQRAGAPRRDQQPGEAEQGSDQEASGGRMPADAQDETEQANRQRRAGEAEQGERGGRQSGDEQQSSEQNRPDQRPGDANEQERDQSHSDGAQGVPSQSQSSEAPDGQPTPGEAPADQQGAGQAGQNQPGQNQPGEQQQQTQSNQRGGQQGASNQDNPLSTFLRQGGTDSSSGSTGPHLGPQRPLTSSEFVQWSDRMRDVEEMLDNPELRAEVARIRDRAREMRIDVKRHSKAPDWQLVRTSVYGPMLELQDRVAEELARLNPDSEEIVPLDRDPVPDRYSELVRQYYERLGAGR